MRILPVISTLFCVLFPLSLSAQDIVLKSKTGNVRIDGKLVEYDGEFYRVETDLGVLTVDGRTVDCTGDGCPDSRAMVSKFDIAASGDLAETLVPALINAFSQSLGGEVTENITDTGAQTLQIQDATSQAVAEIALSRQPEDKALALLAKGTPVFVASSRLPTKLEMAAVEKAGLGDLASVKQQQILATDGIIVVVSSINPVSTITMANLRKVLLGEISNWRDIGGPDANIDLYLPADESTFTGILENSTIAVKQDKFAKTANRLDSLADISDAAASNPFGLGITSYSHLRNADTLGLRGKCGIYSLPSVFTIKSGGYPLTYNHYFFRPKLRLPIFAREFLDFAKTDQAQTVIRAMGYADLAISSRTLDQQGLRLANAIGLAGKEVPVATIKDMIRLQNGAERLSTTFRFLPGSKQLDTQSTQNAALLASGLILGNYADKTIHIIGFTDSAGRLPQNILLSKKRAETVHKALVAAAPDGSLDDVDFKISGFGEASPLACDNTDAGKQTNRRVEIWIKDS